jgi:hypothetical protein
MKEKNIKIIRIIKIVLIIVVVIYFGYILIMGEIKHHKAVMEFCKQRCNYYPNEKMWGIDLTQFFKDGGILPSVESRMDTEKYFQEKDLDKCIDYCKELEIEYKRLTY